MNLELAGRAALVTGAAGGIGRAVVAGLVAEGARVALVDRDERAVAHAASAMTGGGGGEAIGLGADVTDDASVDVAVARAVERFGGLDVVVAAAGVSGPVGTPLSETSSAQWDGVFAVNAAGAFRVLRATFPWLSRSDAASVVLISSDSAFVASPGMVAYGASKAAVLQLARAAAVEWAPEGVRVNAVCPSIVDTPMSRTDLGLHEGFADASYPVQTAAEVADQVLFLCSPRSRPVNAASLVSDFGFSARTGFPA